MSLRSSLGLGFLGLLAACASTTTTDDAATAGVQNLTEVGAGAEVARCWFDTVVAQPPFVVSASTSLTCSVAPTSATVFTPKVLQIEGQYLDSVLHQPITDTIELAPAPADPSRANMPLQPNEFPLDLRVAGLVQLPSGAANAPAPVVQAVDGRGAFFQTLHVASFADAQARGKDNPFVIKVPLTTWQVRVAIPSGVPASLAVDPYRASIAPWLAADPQNRDTLALQARASSTGKCLVVNVVAPKDGAALSAVVSGLGADLRGPIAGAGDYLADPAQGFRQATAEEAAAGPCAAGSVGAACKADGSCSAGTCVAGVCQDACGKDGQGCCGDASTPFADRCAPSAFCNAQTTCTACGVAGKTCCPNAAGDATSCNAGLSCNTFGSCEAP